MTKQVVDVKRIETAKYASSLFTSSFISLDICHMDISLHSLHFIASETLIFSSK